MRNTRTLGAWATALSCFIATPLASAGDALLVDDTYAGAQLKAKFASKPTLEVGAGSRAFLKFDLSTLPDSASAADVQKAVLWLYAKKAKFAASFGVRRVIGDWSEESSGVAAPDVIAGAEPQSITVPEQGEFIAIDVTALVQAWRSGNLENDGLALVHDLGKITFHSKESKDGKPPRLQIELAGYGPEGEKGDMGPQGPKGDTGSQGPMGDTGAQGPKGDTGSQGSKGDTGNTGNTGPQGPGFGFSAAYQSSSSPTFSDTSARQFVGQPAIVTINALSDIVHVTSSANCQYKAATTGSHTTANKAISMQIGYRISGASTEPMVVSAAMYNLNLPTSFLIRSRTGVFSNLSPGDYEFGLACDVTVANLADTDNPWLNAFSVVETSALVATQQ